MSSPTSLSISVPSPRGPASMRSTTPTESASVSSSARTSVLRTSSFSQAHPHSPSHARRPSVPLSPGLSSTSPRAVPLPVPQRHPAPLSAGGGGYPTHRGSFGKTASASDVWGPASPGGVGVGAGARPAGHGRTNSAASVHRRDSHSQTQGGGLGRAGSLNRSAGWLESGMQRRAVQRERADPVVPVLGLGGLDRVRASWEAEDDRWLDITAHEILDRYEGGVECVKSTLGMEPATDVFLKSARACLLVELSGGAHAFFDYADLNTFLLLVLQAASKEPLPDAQQAVDEDADALSSDRCAAIVARLRAGRPVSMGDICNISQKNEYHAFPSTTTLRTLLPLFASGLHRVAISADQSVRPLVLNENMLLEYLISLPDETRPDILSLPVSSPALLLGLNPLVSLPGASSVLDAMQVMALHGYTALGVLNGTSSRPRSHSHSSSAGSGSSGSGSGSYSSASSLLPRNSSAAALTASPGLLPSPAMPIDPLPATEGAELLAIVTAQECAGLVVPSEGKKILGMSLVQMARDMQVMEPAGMEKGEERFPVHTVSASATLLHASHLILATASSRVFFRSGLTSPPLSPTPSLSLSASSPFSSPALSQLSLSDPIGPNSVFGPPYGAAAAPVGVAARAHPGLPPAPPTRLSSHSVISILDILSCLAKAYASRLTPPTPDEPPGALGIRGAGWAQPGVFTTEEEEGLVWDLDPKGLGRRRRTGSISQAMRAGGFERWRWVAEDKA